jgi:hypothetical protein
MFPKFPQELYVRSSLEDVHACRRGHTWLTRAVGQISDFGGWRDFIQREISHRLQSTTFPKKKSKHACEM